MGNGSPLSQALDFFLLLLIGMGPKIAMVPFLELTQGMDPDTKRRAANRMVRVAVGTALFLVALGWLLMRLLHFTPGAANIAGGIVLLLLALHMLMSPGKTTHHEQTADRDPMQTAVYPLAVPYMLNPAGIAALVTISSDIRSLLMAALVVGLVLLVGAIDFLVFRNIEKIARHLDVSRLAVTEAIFGVLLAALAVQLVLDGLAQLGLISLTGH
ncbi:MarC family protein [Thiohalomonas denitrificans]|uniref:MarC family protein n=1 Tax=Thiohalomonas denitrificans TaxID=415747 RepID=UPI0026EC13AF|nr:MarC family protein [Thiohalomonas denitrificans]